MKKTVGRPKLISDEQLREIDDDFNSGKPIASAARRLGITPKQAHNAHYKLRMRRAYHGADIGDARTLRC